MTNDFDVSGRVVDVVRGESFSGRIRVRGGRIAEVEHEAAARGGWLLPGLVDAHVHIESSLLPPSEFARAAVVHGTVATVSDPHEIANVLGARGVRFMVEDAARVPVKFHFGAPSCVPATPFETSGAVLDAQAVRAMLAWPEIGYLSEVMNFPGVLAGDRGVLAKIEAARAAGKPVDGHAPLLRGEALRKYAAAGIGTDHECTSLAEAMEKIALGMKILIRCGSAADDSGALLPLLASRPESCMFCSDDLHPDDLWRGHINLSARRAIAAGHQPIAVIRAATLNPARHYGLGVGLIQPGDPADLIEVGDLNRFNVLRTWIDGRLVAERGVSLLPRLAVDTPNHFEAAPKASGDFRLEVRGSIARAIVARESSLLTGEAWVVPKREAGCIVADPMDDILKIAVVNRYREAPPAVGLVKGFGIARGAIASSVAHDSHNIVAVGADDADLAAAVNEVIRTRGGLCAARGEEILSLPLPIAGLMSDLDFREAGERYAVLNARAQQLGSRLRAPFMTLSFMALLVIPKLKLGDRGLFDGERFEFVPLVG
jgi:adenine deaminase